MIPMPPEGIEPSSLRPKRSTLSVKLRGHNYALIYIRASSFAKATEGRSRWCPTCPPKVYRRGKPECDEGERGSYGGDYS